MNNSLEKLALGNDFTLHTSNFKARIPIIYGKGNTGSIDLIVENEDKTRINNISFELEDGQILNEGDYIDKNGLNLNGNIIEFSENQIIQFEKFQDIILYNGYTHLYFSNDIKPEVKLYYYERNKVDEQIYVLDKYEQLIAVFNKNDEDTLIEPKIEKTQNAEAIFQFSISLSNPKWKQINNPENLYLVDGMMFSTNFDGCFEETISENDEKLMSVKAYERQKLLTRKYVRTWNSETNIEKIDTFMVVVLSKGDLPLKNDDNIVETKHLPGTSGYALDALLYDTDWNTGICDVEGEFDLETDQIDVYENILKVQEIWGGILVFDSVNKIVHHRDETKWLPYDGYEVKYRKNMQSLEKVYNNKIVTRLCPLGESNLNIKSVNNDSEWLEDFSYTDTVLEGIENNPDITDPEQLMRWGKRKLQDLSRPSKELTVDTVLLYQLEGYELETIDLNDIVDVINYNNIEGETEQLRVINFKYSIWDKSDSTLELSDITLDSTDIFKKTVSATNTINNGTLSSSKVVSYYKNGQSVNDSIRQINETVVQTKTDLIKTDETLTASIQETREDLDTINDEVVSHTSKINKLELTVEGLSNQFGSSGGNNMLRNSVGFFGNDYWEGSITQYTGTEISINNESDSAILLQNGNILQKLSNIKNGIYNISFNYKKLKDMANITVTIQEQVYNLTNLEWSTFEEVTKITDNTFSIKFSSDTSSSCYISDLILITGSVKQTWSQNANETMTDTVSIGKGITVKSSVSNTYTTINADGNRTFNSTTNQRVAEMTDKGVYANELEVKSQAIIGDLLIEKIGSQTWLAGIGG